ncbi:RHS repeat-associated core domain-containing protein [Streptomyces thermolilacinus]
MDALGRTTRMVEPVKDGESITTTFGYDATGNRTRLTDGRGNTTVYTFNAWGMPEATIEPATSAHPAAADRTWTTVYDAAGRSVADLLPGGVKRQRSYDGLDRLVRETGTGAEATTIDRVFTYDLAGRMTAAGTHDAAQRNTYAYNDRGQLLRADGPAGSSRYTYGDDGNMTARTDGAGTTAYGYDVAGRLSLTDDPVTGARTVMSYDAAGRVTAEEYRRPTADGSGWSAEGTRAYTYDALGRLAEDRTVSSAGTTPLARLAYGYDADGRLVRKETEGTAGPGVQTYAYDLAGRMTSATNGATTTPYAWDAAGNRTLAGAAAAAQYDERNRLLSDGTSTYTYTARGTLASVQPSGGSARTLTFDAFERKVADGTATYLYDSLDRMASRDGTAFVYDGGSNNLVSDGASSYTRTPGGTLVAAATGTTRQRLLTDQHTDVVAALTADGTAVSGSTSYDPFGKPQAESGTTPSLGYQSGYTDPANGDINMAARWYQPGTGAFASRDTWLLDPTQSSGRAHRYSYGFGSPLNGTDPTGHIFPLVIGGVALWKAAAALGGATVITAGAYGAAEWASNRDWSWPSSSSSSSSSSSRGGLYDLGNAGAASAAAAAMSAAATRFGAGSSGSSATSSRGGSSSRSAWYPKTRQYGNGSWTYRAAQPQPRVITSPPRPPIPQNPNKGKHPVPAPTRPTPKPDWGIKPGAGSHRTDGSS